MPKTVDLNRIHQSALQVFVERGYEAATTKEIAERASVNEATLYRRFNTKAELIRTALTHELANSPFAQLNGSDDVHSDMVMIVKAYIETFDAFGAVVMVLLVEVVRTPEIQGATAALLPNLQNAARIIARHQASGKITPGNPVSKLMTLIAPIAMMEIAPQPLKGLVGDVSKMNPERLATDFLNGHSP